MMTTQPDGMTRAYEFTFRTLYQRYMSTLEDHTPHGVAERRAYMTQLARLARRLER